MNRRCDVAGVILLLCMTLPGIVSRVLGARPTWLLAGAVLVAVATGLVLVTSVVRTRK